ncbi:BnaC01g31750D [Brassica napus]|nr:PREDICTED: putative cysteine-rich repeat secretory protein 17 [Brassica oleracea var. oleracea]XP_013691545.1 putative cysteine-rich repeat secretory protein 17 [Brassica napus]KAF2543066.1 hypothetical protein F2Q68_00032052 [Brassica cretica]KAF3534832.1 hypothetical protein DY000_02042006 [Brassica cretica]CAF2076995.1 unnamed protein product [Brassica napus]CDY19305.1 BnaC01g31750D [Brassica napus]
MYISPSVLIRLLLVPILAVVAIQLLFVRAVSSVNMTNPYLHHKCFVTLGKYKPGSQYEKNLKRIINEFPKGSFKRGFISMTLGESPDFIVMLFQCRGDTHGPKCRSCYATAKPEFFKRCPRHKGGIIWYDQCSLYFSTIDSLGMIDYDNNFCMSNATKISDDLYNQVKPRHFIDDMIQNATREAKREAPYYMAEEKRVGKETIYGMAECSFDMSQKNCRKCLERNNFYFARCFWDKLGARVLGKSCSFRYEFYPFILPKAGPKYLKP